jgi:hypothetical protein
MWYCERFKRVCVLMDVYNVASGAGKTYTMLGTDSEPGVMVRALTQIFDGVLQTSEEYAYQVSLSYLEVNCHTLTLTYSIQSIYLK